MANAIDQTIVIQLIFLEILASDYLEILGALAKLHNRSVDFLAELCSVAKARTTSA